MTGKICWPCKREMKPKENGVYVVELADSVPGPYKIWVGDLWSCAGCGASVALGFSNNPVAEHWQPEFAAVLAGVRNTDKFVEVPERLEQVI
jgi:hypothetical protein